MRYLILSLLLLTAELSAEAISWHSDYEQTRKEAGKVHKGIMVLLIEEECPPCMKMLGTTLKDKTIVQWVNKRFLAILVTKGQTGSYPIELLYTQNYPTLFFLDSKELCSHEPIFGYVTPQAFKTIFEEAAQ